MKTKGTRIYYIITTVLYLTAILVCFICNLAVNHTLSWFYIVLCSVAVSYSITNLPLLCGRHVLLPALSATLFLFLLLFACNAYTGGDWLYSYGILITAYPVALVWLMLLVTLPKGLNWYYKSALLSLLCGILSLTMNAWINAVLIRDLDSFSHYFTAQFRSPESQYFANGIVAGILAVGFSIYALIGIGLGISADRKKRGR